MKIYIFLTLAIVCIGLMDLNVVAGRGSRHRVMTHKMHLDLSATPMDELIADSAGFKYGGVERTGRRPDEAHGPNGKGQIVELDIMEGEAKDIPEVEMGVSGKGTGGSVIQQDTNLRTLNSRRRESPPEGGNNRQTPTRARGSQNRRRAQRGQGNQQGRGRGQTRKTQGNSARGSQQRNSRVRQRNARRRTRRNAIKETLYYWPDKTLIYSFPSASYTDSEQAVFAEALAEFDSFTCIKFKERTTQNNYVEITKGSGCWSYIGYWFWSDSPGQLSLGTNCLNTKKTPIHELMHSLGVRHQHTRPDRDDYVTVNYESISDSARSNFEKSSVATTNVFNTQYAYDSIMHYGKLFFSSDGGNTISVPLDPSQEDIIGRSPTFSFEDVQLLSSMYSCDDGCEPANCPEGSFQGKDCHCYCRSNDAEVPAIICGSSCPMPYQECGCTQRVGACNGVDHSTCNSLTNQCECDSGYVEHFGLCTLISSIQCDALGVDCKCSLNSGSCDAADSNSECETNTDTCVCKAGYQKENGACINTNSVSCDAADKPCFCDTKGSGVCGGVPQSSCDTDTGACICNQNLYNNAGTCTSTSTCTAIGSGCHCEAQGADACSSLDDTVCDSTSGACVCDPLTHSLEGGVCVFAFRFHVDGSSISPMLKSTESNLDFVVTDGLDAADGDIPSNNKYLYVEGSSAEDIAQIETEWLDSAGDWCLDVKFRLQNARVWRSYEIEEGRSGFTYTFFEGTLSTWRQASTYKKPVTSGRRMKLKLKATPHEPGNWHVAVDAIKVQKC